MQVVQLRFATAQFAGSTHGAHEGGVQSRVSTSKGQSGAPFVAAAELLPDGALSAAVSALADTRHTIVITSVATSATEAERISVPVTS